MFKWQENYSCGIQEIDRQHQRLFEIGKQIYDTASLNDECDHYDELTQTLNELVEYTKYHFGYEEALMEKYNYPDYATHKFEHDFFIKKVLKIAGKDFEEDQNQTMMEIVRFVADWVAGHILDTDMKYRECLIQNGE
jgi:hemerythrin